MALDENLQGIWCKSDNTFYYLETGGVSPNNIDKLRSALISRSKIKYYSDSKNSTETSYRIITLKEAQAEEFEVKPIYINKFVKSRLDGKTDEPTKNPWK